MTLQNPPWGNDPCFEWDEDNEQKIYDHGVSPEEVEECFENPYLSAPHNKAQSEPTKYGDRYRIKGVTNAGRRLFVVVQYLGAYFIRPITAFDE